MKQRGFTLIELLIVVAIIGVIAAIAIPSLFDAIQKAKQKRSMADIKTIATGVQVYAVDNDFYPRIGVSNSLVLAPHLTQALKVTPKRDGWDFPYQFETDTDGSTYTLIALGANRTPDLPYAYGFTRRLVDDIVFTVGVFYQWPDGMQK